MSETKYKVVEGGPGVSLNRKVYAPGDLLPEGLTDEQREQLLKTGAIEEASAKDVTEAEKKDAEELPEKDANDPDKQLDGPTGQQVAPGAGPVPKDSTSSATASGAPAGDDEGAKPTTASTSAPSTKSTGSSTPSKK